jgi:hypothetical protein
MLAADAGANLRELMDRMGHSTTRAATVYLHGGNERQQAIADELSRLGQMLRHRGHESWTAGSAGLARAKDDELTVWAGRKHDREGGAMSRQLPLTLAPGDRARAGGTSRVSE